MNEERLPNAQAFHVHGQLRDRSARLMTGKPLPRPVGSRHLYRPQRQRVRLGTECSAKFPIFFCPKTLGFHTIRIDLLREKPGTCTTF